MQQYTVIIINLNEIRWFTDPSNYNHTKVYCLHVTTEEGFCKDLVIDNVFEDLFSC